MTSPSIASPGRGARWRASLAVSLLLGACAPPSARPTGSGDPARDDAGVGDSAAPLPPLEEGMVVGGVTVSGVVDACPDDPAALGTGRSLLIDPQAPERVWVGVAGRGLFRSIDGGAHWERTVSGLKAHRVSGTRQLCFDRFTSAVLDPADFHHLCIGLAGPSGTVAQPQSAANGVYCSRDDGDRWQQRVSSSMNTAVSALALAPSGGERMWAGVSGLPDGGAHYYQSVGVLYTSGDDGVSWPELDFGPGFVPGMVAADLALGPSSPRLLFAAAPVYHQGGDHAGELAATQYGLLSSSDDGSSWGSLAVGMDPSAGSRAITRVAVAPGGSRLLLATANVPPAPGPYLYYSSDAGGSFQAPSAGVAIDVFAFDPSDAAGLHALGLHSLSRDLWESFDGGATWHSFGGQLPEETAGNPVRLSHLVWSADGKVIYLAGSDAAVYRSLDVGRSFQRVLAALDVVQ